MIGDTTIETTMIELGQRTGNHMMTGSHTQRIHHSEIIEVNKSLIDHPLVILSSHHTRSDLSCVTHNPTHEQ